MPNLKNKVVAITGAASGIGLALAHHLVGHGCKIAIADSNRVALHHAVLEIEAKHPGTATRVFPYELDVRKPAAVAAWLEQTIAKFGRLDGAANLAGVVGNGHSSIVTRDLVDDDWDTVIGVNLNGTKNCLRAELKVMKEGASIVNAASIAGLRACPGGVAYGVSKAGVVSLTQSAAKEEGPRGIRVNAIAPGFVETPMTAGVHDWLGDKFDAIVATTPIPRQGRPEEVAKVIAHLLSDDSSFITGSIQVIDGGLTA